MYDRKSPPPQIILTLTVFHDETIIATIPTTNPQKLAKITNDRNTQPHT